MERTPEEKQKRKSKPYWYSFTVHRRQCLVHPEHETVLCLILQQFLLRAINPDILSYHSANAFPLQDTLFERCTSILMQQRMVPGYQYFRTTHQSHLQTERSVTTYQPIQHNTPEEQRLRLYCGGSLKSHKDAHFSEAIMEKESSLIS